MIITHTKIDGQVYERVRWGDGLDERASFPCA
jgi:hypothetical protein